MLGKASDMRKDKILRIKEADPVQAFLCTDMPQKDTTIPHAKSTTSMRETPLPHKQGDGEITV